jgi:hypothetical protein
MSMKRMLDYDEDTGVTQWFHFDDTTGDIGLQTQQDVTAIVEHNKALFNQVDENARWGDPLRPSHESWQKAASVPMSIFCELAKVTNNFKDKKAFDKWLNNSDNRVFRTRPGRL